MVDPWQVVTDDDGGEATLEEMRATLKGSGIEDFGNHKFGAVIATHTGPGTYGLALEPQNTELLS